MATKTSGLPEATSVTSATELLVNDSGVLKRVAVGTVAGVATKPAWTGNALTAQQAVDFSTGWTLANSATRDGEDIFRVVDDVLAKPQLVRNPDGLGGRLIRLTGLTSDADGHIFRMLLEAETDTQEFTLLLLDATGGQTIAQVVFDLDNETLGTPTTGSSGAGAYATSKLFTASAPTFGKRLLWVELRAALASGVAGGNLTLALYPSGGPSAGSVGGLIAHEAYLANALVDPKTAYTGNDLGASGIAFTGWSTTNVTRTDARSIISGGTAATVTGNTGGTPSLTINSGTLDGAGERARVIAEQGDQTSFDAAITDLSTGFVTACRVTFNAAGVAPTVVVDDQTAGTPISQTVTTYAELGPNGGKVVEVDFSTTPDNPGNNRRLAFYPTAGRAAVVGETHIHEFDARSL